MRIIWPRIILSWAALHMFSWMFFTWHQTPVQHSHGNTVHKSATWHRKIYAVYWCGQLSWSAGRTTGGPTHALSARTQDCILRLRPVCIATTMSLPMDSSRTGSRFSASFEHGCILSMMLPASRCCTPGIGMRTAASELLSEQHHGIMVRIRHYVLLVDCVLQAFDEWRQLAMHNYSEPYWDTGKRLAGPWRDKSMQYNQAYQPSVMFRPIPSQKIRRLWVVKGHTKIKTSRTKCYSPHRTQFTHGVNFHG